MNGQRVTSESHERHDGSVWSFAWTGVIGVAKPCIPYGEHHQVEIVGGIITTRSAVPRSVVESLLSKVAKS